MATHPVFSDEMATAGTGRAGGDSTESYTGVIITHGIGNEKRNDTLQEALNALTYWFNHEAGLTTRPDGPGRIWITTRLTDEDDPDKPSSRATMELVAPAMGDHQTGGDPPVLRLEWREVWWAQSFGLPSVRSALEWAWNQWREEAFRTLLPLRMRVTPLLPWQRRTTAVGAPPQRGPTQPDSAPAAPSTGPARPSPGARLRR